jgi:hypothetical protein
VFLSSGSRLPGEVSSGAATCPMAPGSASLRGELRCYHIFLSYGPRLPTEVGSDAATCYSALDLVSLPRWAPALPRGPGLASPRGELRCCHVLHDPQRAVDHRNKEGSSCPRHATGLTCVQNTVTCYRGTCKSCGQDATVRFNSGTYAQLTTPRHGYNGDTTRQDDTTGRARFSAAER